jgi:NADPH:quinone reductase-like Zn-dependent oxidoreductase
MKAVRIHQFGGPEVLTYEEAPQPVPTADEVLIQVYAAGVNPVDSKTRTGAGVARRFTANPFPLILGWDVSGVVAAVGENVTQFKPGDEVYGMVRFPEVGAAYAEYVTAPAGHVALKPRSLGHIEAAALPLVALTAWQALFETGNLQAGQRVLIHAAAGGVGHIAVQLAKWKGAYVVATASKFNIDFVRQLGADEPVNYTSTLFDETIRGIDLVLEPLGEDNRDRSWRVLKDGGLLVSIVGEPDFVPPLLRSATMLVRPNQEQLLQITQLVDEGIIKPTVQSVVALNDARTAHEILAHGHARGKVVLEVY